MAHHRQIPQLQEANEKLSKNITEVEGAHQKTVNEKDNTIEHQRRRIEGQEEVVKELGVQIQTLTEANKALSTRLDKLQTESQRTIDEKDCTIEHQKQWIERQKTDIKDLEDEDEVNDDIIKSQGRQLDTKGVEIRRLTVELEVSQKRENVIKSLQDYAILLLCILNGHAEACRLATQKFQATIDERGQTMELLRRSLDQAEAKYQRDAEYLEQQTHEILREAYSELTEQGRVRQQLQAGLDLLAREPHSELAEQARVREHLMAMLNVHR